MSSLCLTLIKSSWLNSGSELAFLIALVVKNINELKKIQQRVALWITGAFCTSLSEGVEAIAGLIPITMHLHKLNSRHHLCYASIPLS